MKGEDVKQKVGKLGWQFSGNSISRTFEFGNFREAMDFVGRVAELAEDIRHHPDIEIMYNKVKLALTTHSEGRVTDKDLVMAEKINKMLRDVLDDKL